jgi:hypothetical protein
MCHRDQSLEAMKCAENTGKKRSCQEPLKKG